MTDKFTLKKGDTGVPLRVTLADSAGPINLTGWTVRFVMTPAGSMTKKVDALAAIDPDQTTNRGQISYAWQNEDVDTPGLYECEFICTMPDSKQVTFPRGAHSEAFNLIEIVEGKL